MWKSLANLRNSTTSIVRNSKPAAPRSDGACTSRLSEFRTLWKNRQAGEWYPHSSKRLDRLFKATRTRLIRSSYDPGSHRWCRADLSRDRYKSRLTIFPNSRYGRTVRRARARVTHTRAGLLSCWTFLVFYPTAFLGARPLVRSGRCTFFVVAHPADAGPERGRRQRRLND